MDTFISLEAFVAAFRAWGEECKTLWSADADAKPSPTAGDGERLLFFKDLETEKGITLSEVTIWRMMRDRTFPQSVRVGKQRKAWREREVDEWRASLPVGKGKGIRPRKIA